MATMVIYRMNDAPEMPPEDIHEYERWRQDNAADSHADEAETMLDAYERERDGVDEFDSDLWEV